MGQHEHVIYLSSENASNFVVYLFVRLQGRCAELQTQRNEMSIMMLELERQVLLKDGMFGFFIPAAICVQFLKVVVNVEIDDDACMS
jgi:hypothetical protein